jgi:hypothetical protein
LTDLDSRRRNAVTGQLLHQFASSEALLAGFEHAAVDVTGVSMRLNPVRMRGYVAKGQKKLQHAFVGRSIWHLV